MSDADSIVNAAPVRASNEHLSVELRVNGSLHAVAVRPDDRLLAVLRDKLRLTGTKAVCEMGNCGACTVLVDGEAVYSCLVLAVECPESAIETVESLSRSADLAPLQQAFVDCDGLQCGFCTSGQLMSLEALRRRQPTATRSDVVEAVSGNLCRCGAYEHIIKAGLSIFGVETCHGAGGAEK